MVVMVAGVGGYFAWRNSVEARAHTQLAAALAVEEARVGPPAAFGTQAPTGMSFVSQREKNQAALTKFKEVADAYPNSDAGLFARYRQGATYMALGAPKSADPRPISRSSTRAATASTPRWPGSDSPRRRRRTATTRRPSTASATCHSARTGQLPVDGVLMRLARTQAEAGKASDAEQTFNRVVRSSPIRSFAPDARKELDQLKKASLANSGATSRSEISATPAPPITT